MNIYTRIYETFTIIITKNINNQLNVQVSLYAAHGNNFWSTWHLVTLAPGHEVLQGPLNSCLGEGLHLQFGWADRRVGKAIIKPLEPRLGER